MQAFVASSSPLLFFFTQIEHPADQSWAAGLSLM
jgi:hypothetical protein